MLSNKNNKIINNKIDEISNLLKSNQSIDIVDNNKPWYTITLQDLQISNNEELKQLNDSLKSSNNNEYEELINEINTITNNNKQLDKQINNKFININNSKQEMKLIIELIHSLRNEINITKESAVFYRNIGYNTVYRLLNDRQCLNNNDVMNDCDIKVNESNDMMISNDIKEFVKQKTSLLKKKRNNNIINRSKENVISSIETKVSVSDIDNDDAIDDSIVDKSNNRYIDLLMSKPNINKSRRRKSKSMSY